jgi:hypothetical protein
LSRRTISGRARALDILPPVCGELAETMAVHAWQIITVL